MAVIAGFQRGSEWRTKMLVSLAVKEEDKALQCDLWEVWEHMRCIKVCDRPSHECYSVLIQSVGKALLFVCTKCRCKGTLAWWLLHVELALESTQVQKGLYEQLLEEKHQQVDLLTFK